MPSPKLTKTGRQLAAHYGRQQHEVFARPWALAAVSADQLPHVMSTIRSAALQLSAASLTRKSLQRAAIWCDVPVGVSLTVFIPFVTSGPALSGIAYTALATACGVFMAVSTLVVAAASGRAGMHFALMAALAVLGIAIELPPSRINPTVANAFTAFCVAPAAVYAAFLPMIGIAYVKAWRLTATIDPRARVVIGLLDAVYLASSDARWLHDRRARDRIAMQLERTARMAERDLPRLLTRRIQDPGTSSWVRDHSKLIGARIRECKRKLVLPDTEALDTIRCDMLQLLLHATFNEWDAMCAQQPPPPKLYGFLRRYAPHVITGILLVVAGVALPEFLPALKGAAGSNLRTILVISGIVAFVPVDGGALNRIPDAFAGVTGAKS